MAAVEANLPALFVFVDHAVLAGSTQHTRSTAPDCKKFLTTQPFVGHEGVSGQHRSGFGRRLATSRASGTRHVELLRCPTVVSSWKQIPK